MIIIIITRLITVFIVITIIFFFFSIVFIRRIFYHIDVNIMNLKRNFDENTNQNEQIAKEKVLKK